MQALKAPRLYCEGSNLRLSAAMLRLIELVKGFNEQYYAQARIASNIAL